MKEANHHDYAQAHELVKKDVRRQVMKQISLWGFQRHTFEEWKAIFNEEFAEFECKVIVARETGYKELSHVVAVGMAWMIDMKLKGKTECKEK